MIKNIKISVKSSNLKESKSLPMKKRKRYFLKERDNNDIKRKISDNNVYSTNKNFRILGNNYKTNEDNRNEKNNQDNKSKEYFSTKNNLSADKPYIYNRYQPNYSSFVKKG